MSWAQLREDFAEFAKRPYAVTAMARLVALAEARFNRRLRVRQMEKPVSGTVVNGSLALPADHVATKALWVPALRPTPLKPQGLDFIVAQRRLTGLPTSFAVGADAWAFDGSGAVEGVYFAAIPGLVASGSNWLSVLAYDAYLWATLAEAATDERDTEQAAVWLARAEASLTEVINNDQRDRFTGPLISRKR